jgi:phosphatidylinositol alpha-1,6-mannosyltransferase
MSARRTLLLTEIFPPAVGGSGRLFWEIYRRLPKDQFLIAAADSPAAAAFDRTHDRTVFRLPMAIGDRGLRRYGSLKFYLQTASRVRRIVRDHGIGLIHCGRNLPEGFVGYLVNRWCGVPFTFFTHGEDIGVSRRSREMAWMTRQVMRRAMAAFANSFNTRRLLLEEWGYPDEKVRVIQPGVDATRFVPAERDEAVRAELGWANRTVLLTVGRLQKRKGHDTLIRGLKAIREKHPDVLHAVIGTGEEEVGLRKLVAQEDLTRHVQFLGGVSDERMVQCYQQCDLFVLPNRDINGDIEGFGMVLLEAQACGRPVLAGDSGGTGETMAPPHTGRVVNCDTPEPLVNAVLEMLADATRLREMGRRGREWVEGRFDWPAVADRTAAVFAGIG